MEGYDILLSEMKNEKGEPDNKSCGTIKGISKRS